MNFSDLLPLITFFGVSVQDGSQLLDCLIKTGVYDPQARIIIHHHHRLWSDILHILAGHKTIDETLRLGTHEGRPFIISQYRHTTHSRPYTQHYLLTFEPQATNHKLLFSSQYARVYAPL